MRLILALFGLLAGVLLLTAGCNSSDPVAAEQYRKQKAAEQAARAKRQAENKNRTRDAGADSLGHSFVAEKNPAPYFSGSDLSAEEQLIVQRTLDAQKGRTGEADATRRRWEQTKSNNHDWVFGAQGN